MVATVKLEKVSIKALVKELSSRVGNWTQCAVGERLKLSDKDFKSDEELRPEIRDVVIKHGIKASSANDFIKLGNLFDDLVNELYEVVQSINDYSTDEDAE